MNKNKLLLWNSFKILLALSILFAAIRFENPQGYRFFILIFIFIGYIVTGILRGFIAIDGKFTIYTFFIDIALVYFLEYHSKYIVNYFFHSFYIFILLESSLVLNRRGSLVIGLLTVSTSLVKYIVLMYYKNNITNLAQLAFFVLLSIFILVITGFYQYQKEEKEKKDQLYKELLETHKSLKKYARRVEELTIVEERNRIARDIHDTLGHMMTGIIMELEMVSLVFKEDTEKANELLERAKKSARESLIRIREVVETLGPNQRISKGIQCIRELIDEFSQKTQTDINLHVEGNVKAISVGTSGVLYRIIQESLTNSVRHGRASEINIHIQCSKDQLHFTIQDNGMGVEEIQEGLGLKGIRERTALLGGDVEFAGNDGFTIKGFLPLEGGRYDQSSYC